jgi:hypothetical protein
MIPVFKDYKKILILSELRTLVASLLRTLISPKLISFELGSIKIKTPLRGVLIRGIQK